MRSVKWFSVTGEAGVRPAGRNWKLLLNLDEN